MVILEGHNMLGVNSPNQYLQPDYLSPLPTTLDAKKSPLALLVQTCSQIGADTPSSKSLLHPSPLSSSDSTSSLSSSGGGQKRKASTSSDSGGGMSYKSLSSDSSSNDSRPRSSGSTSSTCSSAKQPRLSSNMNTSNNSQTARRSASPNGKVSPKYTNHHNNNNNNNNNDSPTGNKDIHYSHSKIRKLSGQSMSSESSEKNRNRSSPPNQNQNQHQHHNHHSSSNHHNQSSSVIVPQGKHSGSSSVGSRSPNPEKSSKSSSSSEAVNNTSSSKHSSNSSPKPPTTTSSSSSHHDQGQSPIIRSGLDVLQGKDLPKMSSGFGAFGYPPGFDPTNPAFRLPFLSSAHAAAAAHHAHLLGYPPMPSAGPPGSSPYLAYSRVKSASGVESIVPVCKDPYCTGCQYSQGAGGMPPVSSASSAMNNLLSAAAAAAAANGAGGPSVCPAGCAQCDHQKFPLIPPSATSGPYASIPGFPPGISHAAIAAAAAGYPQSFHPHAVAAAMMQNQQAAAVAAAAAAQQQNAQRPYICNWIVADSYCGKRFPSSEELLQHLRTHTNSSSAQAQVTGANTGSTDTASITSNSTSAALAAAHAHAAAANADHARMQHQSSAALYSNALLNQSAMAAAAAAMHRNYPTPPLSPHSAARYNPYLAAAAAASGKPPGSMPPHPSQHPALAGYYPSPYSIYGQRIG